MAYRTVLITGATDGIGLALARLFQPHADRLVLVGRRALDTLDPALFTPDTYCRVDLAYPPGAAIVDAFLKARQIDQIDLLIQNAALGYYGPTAHQPSANIRALLAVNLRAPLALTHTLLPYLPAGRGKLVFISSIAADLPSPDYAVYGASKAALDGFARSLREELHGNIAVQVIHPGATRTAIHEKSGAAQAGVRWQRFPSAERVAARIARAIDSSRESVTIGAGNRLLQLAGRHMGGGIDWLMRRRYR